MAIGLNSLLSIGNGALASSQVGIHTTGNNISNVNTPGYSRQYVDFRENAGITYRPGQVGQGARAQQILRVFDRFVENSYLDKANQQSRYEEEHSLLQTVETMFNESNRPGINDALTKFFNAWNTLAQAPSSEAGRVALIAQAKAFASALRDADQGLANMQSKVNETIQTHVNQINAYTERIANLTSAIKAETIKGVNNPNQLLDERDQIIRELNKIIDVTVQDNDDGTFIVKTCNGLMLVQDASQFKLSFEGQRVENNLGIGSQYNGSVEFAGSDGYEYSLDVVVPGVVDTTGFNPPPDGTAQYRVSLDGGKSWMKDENGKDMLFYATDTKHPTLVKNLHVSFTGTNKLEKTDMFLLTPKSDVFWHSQTKGPVDITPQIFSNGVENGSRITGGKLGGLFEFRDRRIGEYRDSLASFADTLIWEVNRLHSQGSGTKNPGYALGSYQVANTDVPLGARNAGFHWFDKLQSGNVSFAIYDAATNKPALPYPGVQVFSPENFDPSKHTLEDVRNAINQGPASSYLTATIIDNRLQLTAKDGYTFSVSSDTSGLAAGLGINTFFTGETPSTIGINNELIDDVNLIAAGRINGAGETNKGDNITANEIAALAGKNVEFTLPSGAKTKQTMGAYYGALVSYIGADTSKAKFMAATERAVAQELHDKSESISGVSLDEEMTNLIKFQSSYKAAAKLITTADQMLQTLLSLKQ